MKITIEEIKKRNNINLEKTPKLIGVFGIYGKTSTAHLVIQYLKRIGKKVSYSISAGMENIEDENFKNKFNPLTTKEEVEKIIVKSLKTEPDFIILELHEFYLNGGGEASNIAQDIQFDFLIFPKLERVFNSDNGSYYRSCFTPILTNNIGTKLIVNKFFVDSSDKLWRNWLEEITKDSTEIIEYGIRPAAFYSLKELTTPKYFPEKVIFSLNKFILSMNINETKYNFLIEKCPFFYAENIMGMIAVISELGLMNADELSLFLNSFDSVPGRSEMMQFDNKIVMIDDSLNILGYFADLPTSSDSYTEEEVNLINNFYNNKYEFYETSDRIVLLESVKSQMRDDGSPLTEEEVNIIKEMCSYSLNKVKFDFLILSDVSVLNCDMETIDNYIMENMNKPYLFIKDRKEAIKYALDNLKDGELLLISGRGDSADNFDANFKNDPFRDIDIVNEWFEENM